MKILHLVLKKKWFDMIESGFKKEEYRDAKDYWHARLPNKNFDAVEFRLAYSKQAKRMRFKLDRIEIGLPRKEWSEGQVDAGQFVYVIVLGERL